jgi:hypothetical protein
VRTVADLDSRLIARGPWRATISGYDWLYKKDVFSGMGGAMSMLWHRTLGPLFSASLATYVLAEPNNMQPRPAGPDFCLTPRVEVRNGNGWFSNIFDPGATIATSEAGGRIQCDVRARLCDASQKDAPAGAIASELRYTFSDAAVTIGASVPGTDATLVLPLISPNGEAIRRVSPRRFEVKKDRGTVVVEADAPLAIADVGGDRVFNLVPGFAAIPFVLALPGGRGSCTVRVR